MRAHVCRKDRWRPMGSRGEDQQDRRYEDLHGARGGRLCRRLDQQMQQGRLRVSFQASGPFSWIYKSERRSLTCWTLRSVSSGQVSFVVCLSCQDSVTRNSRHPATGSTSPAQHLPTRGLVRHPVRLDVQFPPGDRRRRPLQRDLEAARSPLRRQHDFGTRTRDRRHVEPRPFEGLRVLVEVLQRLADRRAECDAALSASADGVSHRL